MQALVYHEPANLVLEEVPEPHPLQGRRRLDLRH